MNYEDYMAQSQHLADGFADWAAKFMLATSTYEGPTPVDPPVMTQEDVEGLLSGLGEV